MKFIKLGFAVGDLYEDALQDKFRQEWKVRDDEAGPYLRHIRDTLLPHWPYYRILSDFMELGPSRHGGETSTAPTRKYEWTYSDDRDKKGK